MLGLSLTKILFTVGAIVVVWKVFRYIEARGKAQLQAKSDQSDAPDTTPRAVEELIECATCSTYVPAAGTAPCERPDCPYLP